MGIVNKLETALYNLVTVPKSGLESTFSSAKTPSAGLRSGLKTVPKSGLESPNPPCVAQNGTFSGIETVYRRQKRIMQAALIKKRMGAGIVSRERGARHVQYALRLSDPFALDTLIKSNFAESLSLGSGSHHVIVRRDHDMVIIEFALKDTYWEFYDRSNVSGLGIGLATQSKQVDFEFGHNISNALFGGTINSGKSIAVSSAMLAMMGNYSPDKLKFIIIDPHNDYDNFANCSHLIAPVANTNDQIINGLMTAKKVLDHRRRNNIKDDFRLTVTIDEINEVSAIETDTEGPFNAYDAIKDLTNARKYNIGVIAAGQELTKDNLPGKDKYPNRFIGKVLKEHSAFATGQKGLQADKLLGEGDFYHIKFGDATRFQVAQPSPVDYDKLERGELATLDYELSDNPINEPLVDDSKPGRPKAKVEAAVLADFMTNGNLSKRKAQQLGYGQTTWKLHKMFLDKLYRALEAKGFSLEIRGI